MSRKKVSNEQNNSSNEPKNSLNEPINMIKNSLNEPKIISVSQRMFQMSI